MMSYMFIIVTLFIILVTAVTADDEDATADLSPAEERMDRHRMEHEKQQRTFGTSQAAAAAAGGSLIRSSGAPRALCNGCVKVDLVFHILANNQGNSDAATIWTSQAITDEVARVNQHFSNTPFTFNMLQTITTRNNEYSSTSIENDDLIDNMVADLRVGGADVANIFVTDGTCKTTGGFANYPRDHGWFPEGTYSYKDRIFLCSTQLGEIANGYFHTLVTHELGHWFGLRHTWAGRDCNAKSPGDFVDDTPHHSKSSSNSDCAVGIVVDSCTNLPGHDPTRNFMNGAICRDEFTPGQADRMYAQFNAYRRPLEPCGYADVRARFEVRFGSKSEDIGVAFAEYVDGDRDWTDLKELEPDVQDLNYDNLKFSRDLCLSSQTLYTFVLRDVAENGFASPGYASLTLGGREVLRETTFDDEWASTFVVTDFCNAGQKRFSLDIGFAGDAEEITWDIRDSQRRTVVNRDTTATYTDPAYRRLYFEKCLDAGDYEFTIYDSGGNGIQSPGYYKVAVDNNQIFQGGGFIGSFSSSESTSFTVASRAGFTCFSGESTVTVAGKGTVQMKDVKINDLIHIGDDKFEPVYSFGHYQPLEEAQFLRIQADTMVLELSEDHLVFTHERGAIPVVLLVVGDELVGASNERLVVDAITVVNSRGIFAPFTPSGKLVVGGVLASSFIALENDVNLKIGPFQFSHQWIAHTFEFPHRVYCRNWDCSSETYDANGISKWLISPLAISRWILGQHTILKHIFLFFSLVMLLLIRCFQTLLWLFPVF